MSTAVALVLLAASVAATVVAYLVWRRMPATHYWYTERGHGAAPAWADREVGRVTTGRVGAAIPEAPLRRKPPDAMRPSEVGFVMSGRPRHRDQTAALLDLIGKGGLNLTTRGDGRSAVSAGEPLERLNGPEQALVRSVSRCRSGITLTALEYEVAADLDHLTDAVVADRAKRWWLPRERPPLLILAPGIVLALSTLVSPLWSIGVVTAIALCLLRLGLPGKPRVGRTEDGTSAAVQCLAWARYLGGEWRSVDPHLSADELFWTHAAWIVACGVEEDWRAEVPGGVALCDALMGDGAATREPPVTVELAARDAVAPH